MVAGTKDLAAQHARLTATQVALSDLFALDFCCIAVDIGEQLPLGRRVKRLGDELQCYPCPLAFPGNEILIGLS